MFPLTWQILVQHDQNCSKVAQNTKQEQKQRATDYERRVKTLHSRHTGFASYSLSLITLSDGSPEEAQPLEQRQREGLRYLCVRLLARFDVQSAVSTSFALQTSDESDAQPRNQRNENRTLAQVQI